MSATTPQRHQHVALVTRVVAMSLTFAVVVALGVALHISQMHSQRQLAERFEARGQLAASFSSTWVGQLIDQERRVAVDSLSGSDGLSPSFGSAVHGFDFPAAVLLDSEGRALAVHPRAPELIGSDLASRYRHLARAVNGQPAISSAVSSAGRGLPVVAFAVPYDTPQGRRVFSGAYQLNHTPLGAFLRAVTAIPDSRVYVVDASGTVVATSTAANDVDGPREMPAALAAAQQHATDGDYDDRADRRYFFTSQPVAGTPWTLVLTAPHDTLFAPIRGKGHAVPWIVLGLVALLAAGANWMLLRLLSGRDRLRDLNEALDASARTDQLTNLPNRRHLDEALTSALSAGGRHQLPVSVLVMDLDHFKQVNDTYGHTTGDRVLEHVARALQAAVRTEDMVGRWGGEEFLAVLPYTDSAGASLIADRVRNVVKDGPYTNEAGDRSTVTTLSIGCATTLTGGSKDELIHRADQALYRAKAEGRDSVRSADPEHELVVDLASTLATARDLNPPL